MKNLVMGVAANYAWYDIEPFVLSYKQHCENTDLILFVDNISDFTRDTLLREGVILVPVPDELKSLPITKSRWVIYKLFLERYGGNYRQVFLTDVHDVIFQKNLFAFDVDKPNYLICATEEENIKNPKDLTVYGNIEHLVGKEVAEKLGDKKIISSGTVFGTLNEVKYFADKVTEILQRSNFQGNDQAIINYLVYENLLGIENLIESDCNDGIILTSALFHSVNPIQIQNHKILRGDGGTPEIVHQYNRYPILLEFVNKTYRTKDFQLNENFTDTRSVFEQVICAVSAEKIDDAYKLFTRYLFGKNLTDFVDSLIKILEMILSKESTLAAELLSISIQGTLPSIAGFNIEHINKIRSLTEALQKSSRIINPQFKTFVAKISFMAAQHLYSAKKIEQCLEYIHFAITLGVPLDANFYLLQAEVYRETGKKAEALAAYEKSLNL